MSTQASFGAAAFLVLSSAVLSATDKKEPDIAGFVPEVRMLVERHYPDRKFTLGDGVIKLEFKTRTFQIHEPQLNGEWQDACEQVGPQKRTEFTVRSNFLMASTMHGCCSPVIRSAILHDTGYGS